MIGSLFRRLFGAPKTRTNARSEFLSASIPGAPDSASAVLSDPYSNHAIVNRCVDLIASSISSVPLRILTGSDSAPTEIKDGRWYDLFLEPRPGLAGPDFIEATAVLMALSGDAFWILEGSGDGPIGPDEIPSEMWPIPGSCVQEILSEDRRTVAKWRITTAAGMCEYPPHAVVQHRFQYNPANPHRGMTPLISARAAVRLDSKAARFAEDFFDNGGQIGTAILFDKDYSLDPEQRAQYRKELEERHSGWGKAHRTLVLSGADVKSLSGTHADAQFVEQKKQTKQEICIALGIPTTLVGDVEVTTYASAREAKRQLYENRVFPLMHKIERTAEAQLFRNRATKAERARAIASGSKRALWMQFDIGSIAALLSDTTDRLDQAAKAQGLGYSLNQINERYSLGFPRVAEGGDVPLIKVGLVPLDMAAAGLGAAGITGVGVEPSAPAAPEAQPEQKPEAQPEPKQPERSAADSAETRQVVLRAIHKTAMLPLQRRFEAALRGHFQRCRQDLLAAAAKLPVDRAAEPATIDDLLAKFAQKWDKQIADRLHPLYVAGVDLGAKSLAEQMGALTKFNTSSPAVLKMVKDKQNKVTGINETLRDALRKTLIEGMGEGENLAALQERIRATMTTAQARALTIARTEAAQVVNATRQEAMKAEGVTKTQWLSSKSPNMRASHGPIDGEIVPLGQKFSIGVRYPGDVEGPAEEAINCGCSSAPVLD